MDNIESKNLKFVLVDINDAKFILSLRSNKILNEHLSYIENSIENQQEWILDYKEREKNKKEYYFKICDKNNCELGLVRLYNIDYTEKVLTFGSFILTPERPKLTALEATIMMMEITFKILKMKKVILDVRIKNSKASNFYERFGFEKYDSNQIDDFYELTRDKYCKMFNKEYNKYI
ncbi:MAG: GNAT family N-acetyltransferase [Bacilli bacterium]